MRFERLLHIGDDIKACLLGIHGQQARIGIRAPDDVLIAREELWEDWKNDPKPE